MDRYASRLSQYLRAEQTEFAVQTSAPISQLSSEVSRDERGNKTWTAQPRSGFVRETQRYIMRYLTYPRKVGRIESDLAHILDHSYGHILQRLSSRPVVMSVHDLVPVKTVGAKTSGITAGIRNHFLGRALRGIREADAWIVFTEYVKRELAEWLGDDKNIYVIPHGVDEIFFREDPSVREETRDRWGIPQDAFVVLHVGSGIERKNLPTVFAAVGGLRRDGLDAWLLQAGATLTKDQIKTVKSLGLDEHAVFLGQIEEKVLRSAYKASDVFCFPSQYEGFGLPVLEAMASGLPVVSSGAGGLSEVQGDAGVIVRSNDSEPYRAELHRIASDSAHRTQKANQGVERAHQFTWSRAARSTADVYRKMLA